MATKKPKRKILKATPYAALDRRVRALEEDFSEMRGDMTSLTEVVMALRTDIKQGDERGRRVEHLQMEMQGEQRKQSLALERIADKLNVGRGSDSEVAQLRELAEAKMAEALADSEDDDPSAP